MIPRTKEDLAAVIDQTHLGLGASRSEIETFVAKAVEYGFGCVCVLPNAVSTARKIASGTRTKVATVISFPLGMDVPYVKRAEARDALERGADEIDMVIDVAAARMGDKERLLEEVAAVREIIPEGNILKTIIEVPLLTPEQAVGAAVAAEKGGAHMIKTSTGFKGLKIRGTSPEDVQLLRSVLKPRTGIKASGGISSWNQAAAILEAGAARIGTSSGIAIVDGFLASAQP
jgi:deoxyribose-phosphate aldolase